MQRDHRGVGFRVGWKTIGKMAGKPSEMAGEMSDLSPVRVGSGLNRVGLTRFATEDATSGVTHVVPKRRRSRGDVAGALCVGWHFTICTPDLSPIHRIFNNCPNIALWPLNCPKLQFCP